MIQYKKILIPIDFSESSEFATRKGISLAQIYHAVVYVLHVGENSQKSAQRLSKFIRNRIGFESPVTMKKLVAQGSPETTILAAAKKIQADMIVMGSRSASAIKQFMQGSVAEKILRESPCPVIVIKKRKHTDFDGYVMPQIRELEGALQIDKILVPLDFSAASKRALQHAVAMASYYSSTIYTLTVFDKKFKEYGNDHQKHTSVIVHGEKIKLWEEFPELLREINCDLPQTRLKRMLLSGDPFSKIESVVQKKEIDWIGI